MFEANRKPQKRKLAQDVESEEKKGLCIMFGTKFFFKGGSSVATLDNSNQLSIDLFVPSIIQPITLIDNNVFSDSPEVKKLITRMMKRDNENVNEPAAKKRKPVSVKYKEIEIMSENVTTVKGLFKKWLGTIAMSPKKKKEMQMDLKEMNRLLDFQCLQNFQPNESMKEKEKEDEERMDEDSSEKRNF
jgi:hypothetical protein